MSWNVQNLFDGIADGGEYPEFNPSQGNWDERLYRRRLERTGEVISLGGSPDLVVLQELEKPAILDELADGPLARRGYRWRIAVPGFGVVRCGVLSRFPVDNVQVRDCGLYGAHYLRPVLLFTVHSPAGDVRVAALHWKSPRGGREATESARIQEAGELLAAVEGESLPLLIVGDLNTPGDGTLRPSALGPWFPGVNADSSVIFRSSSPQEAGEHNGVRVFYDPEPDASQGQSGTYWRKGEWERPDRALLSAALTDGRDMEFQLCRAGGIAVMEDNIGRPRRWITRREEGYSDHLPLFLEFVRRP